MNDFPNLIKWMNKKIWFFLLDMSWFNIHQYIKIYYTALFIFTDPHMLWLRAYNTAYNSFFFYIFLCVITFLDINLKNVLDWYIEWIILNKL